MPLTVNPEAHQLREYECGCCKAPIQRTWNVVYRDGDPYAVYYASSYHHADQPHETWIDVVLGYWDQQEESGNHVTFGCRVGPVVDSPDPAATLVQACLDGSAGELHGQPLSREEGLAHPRLKDFWDVVDFVLVNDPVVAEHLYHHG
jgi:hypothetical protein